MPLINLQTDLRSLRFGNDRPGGGSSNQPYIQKPIPSPEDSPSNLFNTGGKDILNRGGLLAPIKGVNDVSRLSQMFFDFKSPSGPLFTAKQNLLSRTSVKTEASKGAGYGGGGVNQGVYLPTSTILQAGAGFTGTHLNLLGIDPSSPISGVVEGDGLLPGLGLNGYSSIMKQKFTENLANPELLKENNRLVGLYNAISLGEPKERFGGQKGVDLNTNGNTVLLEYGGGPGSILGIGKTRIPFADQRTGKQNRYAGGSTENKNFFLGSNQLTVVSTPEDFTPSERYNPKVQEDFRKNIIEKNTISGFSPILATSPGYTSGKAIEKRVDSGDPGKSRNVYSYGLKANEIKALDKITAMPMYEGVGPNKEHPINDLVKFRIATINNNESDGSAVYMHFRAFIDSFSDNYSATWNPVQYVGRGDSLANYGGFTRNISIGFTVAAQSKAELIPMYKKLNYLASSLAPDYTNAGFMRGNLVRITMGGYIYEQPGYLTSLTYTIPQESPWEIAITDDDSNKSDESVKELPHIITVSLAFTPIHNFLPQKGNIANNPDQRYIALANALDRGNYADEYLFPIKNADSENQESINNFNRNQLSLSKLKLRPSI
jgi:hypothetical protein